MLLKPLKTPSNRLRIRARIRNPRVKSQARSLLLLPKPAQSNLMRLPQLEQIAVAVFASAPIASPTVLLAADASQLSAELPPLVSSPWSSSFSWPFPTSSSYSMSTSTGGTQLSCWSSWFQLLLPLASSLSTSPETE